MKDFIYNTPTKVYFGKDTEKQVGSIIREYGYKKIMMQYGKGSVKKSGLYDVVINSLTENGIEVVEMGGVEPNPKITFVRDAIKVAKKEQVELILAVGGGSVIDSCKYTALGAKADCDVWDFSMGKQKPVDALPVACILTMAAAGSEMSNSAVITNLELNMKKGCSTEFNRLKFAIMNPELTFTVSDYQTACGVVDIMSHTMERYFTVHEPTDLTDRIAESILISVIDAAKVLVENPTDYNARATIMWASSLSHNGLTGCGRENYLAVHQLEHALSGEFDRVAHGAGLAVLFPAWMKYIYKENPQRFAQFARRVFGVCESDDLKAAEKGIDKMKEFFAYIKMPLTLRELGIEKQSIERLADLCTYGKTREIKSYLPLDYQRVKEIFELSF
ncbi:MAG: iron-containing alcohol dehydrogenase [Clostridia bacterium]|nr:iron-containing alcohol dehydrogenase [Clostridia bacterium]